MTKAEVSVSTDEVVLNQATGEDRLKDAAQQTPLQGFFGWLFGLIRFWFYQVGSPGGGGGGRGAECTGGSAAGCDAG